MTVGASRGGVLEGRNKEETVDDRTLYVPLRSPETSSDGERSPRWRTKADVAAEERALKKRRKNAGGSGGGGKAAWRKNKPKRKEASSSASAASVASSLQNLLPVPPAHLPDAVVAGGGFECCPTTTDVVQPRGGVNMEGHLVKVPHFERFSGCLSKVDFF